MSSTNTFGGYDQKRPTSKVLNPPGGKSNINLFGDSEQDTPVKSENKNQHDRNKSSLFLEGEHKSLEAAASPKVAAASCVPPRSQNNPLGSSRSDAGETLKKPSTRVVAPPGGASSGFAFG